MKIIKLAFIVCLIAGILLYLTQWRSPGVFPKLKSKNQQAHYEMVVHNPRHKHIKITSMEKTFDVYYVENIRFKDPYAYNPYFPAIYIPIDDSCTGWLQVITTDNTTQPEYRHFIDSFPAGYPFYTTKENFQDTPSWNYSFFEKPLSFWKANTYAVNLDNVNKTIKCLGGISWGYRLSQFSFKPSMILPEPLNKKDWQKDWEEMYKPVFKNYRDTTKIYQKNNLENNRYNTLISISDEQKNIKNIQHIIKPLIDTIIQEETKNTD